MSEEAKTARCPKCGKQPELELNDEGTEWFASCCDISGASRRTVQDARASWDLCVMAIEQQRPARVTSTDHGRGHDIALAAIEARLMSLSRSLAEMQSELLRTQDDIRRYRTRDVDPMRAPPFEEGA